MTPPVSLKTACPKCGYDAREHTWRGPKYLPGIDVGTGSGTFINKRLDNLEFTCEGCGFKTRLPCLDAKS